MFRKSTVCLSSVLVGCLSLAIPVSAFGQVSTSNQSPVSAQVASSNEDSASRQFAISSSDTTSTEAAVSTPVLAPSHISNFDSVSLVIENFGSPSKGIYRGAQPSAEGFKALKEIGVKTVINFRNESKKVQKEKLLVESLGMQYISIPWDGRKEPRKEDVMRFIELVKSSNSLPVFFHCRRGAERTGVMWASYRVAVDGWDPDKASQEMKKYNFRAFWFPHLTKFLYDFSRDYGFQKEYTKNSLTKAKTWFLSSCIYSPFSKRVNA